MNNEISIRRTHPFGQQTPNLLRRALMTACLTGNEQLLTLVEKLKEEGLSPQAIARRLGIVNSGKR